MSWKDIAGGIAKVAPFLAELVGGPIAPAVTMASGLISHALGTNNDPDAVAEKLKSDPEALAKVKQCEIEHAAELKIAVIKANTARLTQINTTIRAEAASNDPYVRRWRPTFGYSVSFSWTVQMIGYVAIAGWAVVQHPDKAAAIIAALGAMISGSMVLWGIALSVLGVNVSKRSQDKQVLAGQEPTPGLLSKLTDALGALKRG